MLDTINSLYPVRYTAMGLSVFGLLLGLFSLIAFGVGWPAVLLCAALVAVGVYDLRQDKRSVLRNYPIDRCDANSWRHAHRAESSGQRRRPGGYLCGV